jgi:hypothetical protein
VGVKVVALQPNLAATGSKRGDKCRRVQ